MLVETIKMLCRAHGISVPKLEDKLGFGGGTISKWNKSSPSVDKLRRVAEYFQLTVDDLLTDEPLNTFQKYRRTEHYRQNAISLPDVVKEVLKGIQIPVLGNVPAGIPLEAITDIVDYEEISPALASSGEYFALRIKGNSMAPRICDGDVVIVKKESTVDSGDVAIILVNGNEATCKEVKFSNAGLTLVGWNVAEFSPMFFTKEEVESLPVRIIGHVVEVRIKSLKSKK